MIKSTTTKNVPELYGFYHGLGRKYSINSSFRNGEVILNATIEFKTWANNSEKQMCKKNLYVRPSPPPSGDWRLFDAA